MSASPDRREFIAGAAALLAAPSAAAADAPLFSFALVTDTHLGKPGADHVKRMATAVSEINESKAEFTVFCGDLVDRGEVEANRERYAERLDLAKGLKNDFTAVPGNHDPVALFTKEIRPQTDSVIEFKDVRVLAFADAEPNPGHRGGVTEEQMKWLQARLNEAKKDQRVIPVAFFNAALGPKK